MVRLTGGPAATLLSINLDRHETRQLAACCRCKLAPPGREQPTGDAMAPSHLGNVGIRLKALRDDPGLLLRHPSSSPALPGDHLDTTIRVAFLPGIKHGICHRSPPTISSCQAVSQANLTMARWGPHAGYASSRRRREGTSRKRRQPRGREYRSGAQG